jgi:hypothetical protein
MIDGGKVIRYRAAVNLDVDQHSSAPMTERMLLHQIFTPLQH